MSEEGDSLHFFQLIQPRPKTSLTSLSPSRSRLPSDSFLPGPRLPPASGADGTGQPGRLRAHPSLLILTGGLEEPGDKMTPVLSFYSVTKELCRLPQRHLVEGKCRGQRHETWSYETWIEILALKHIVLGTWAQSFTPGLSLCTCTMG